MIENTMTAGSALPLAAHMLFCSQDLDEARDRVAGVFCDHRLETIGSTRISARHHHFAGDRLSLNYIEYGAKTLIAPGELDSFYLLQFPVEGAAAITNGPDRYYSHPNRAAILNPHRATVMIWAEECRQILVWIDRKALHEHLSIQIGSPAVRPLTFEGGLDLTDGPGARLKMFVDHLIAGVDCGQPAIGGNGLMARQIEASIMSGLLDTPGHNYAALIGARPTRLAPRQVLRAEAFMRANLENPITLEDAARAAGVSARTLQQGFREFRNTTPMRFLRDARLDRAHQDLQSAAPGAAVTDIALRWGFTHFGRFAQIYRQRYGSTPNRTLVQARASGFET